MTPIHLEDYDVFARLAAWAALGGEQKRHWEISLWRRTTVMCRLSWRFGDSQLGGVTKCAASPHEAVSLALDEFRRWEELQ